MLLLYYLRRPDLCLGVDCRSPQAPTPVVLTAQQRATIEENRLKAAAGLAKKRAESARMCAVKRTPSPLLCAVAILSRRGLQLSSSSYATAGMQVWGGLLPHKKRGAPAPARACSPEPSGLQRDSNQRAPEPVRNWVGVSCIPRPSSVAGAFSTVLPPGKKGDYRRAASPDGG